MKKPLNPPYQGTTKSDRNVNCLNRNGIILKNISELFRIIIPFLNDDVPLANEETP